MNGVLTLGERELRVWVSSMFVKQCTSVSVTVVTVTKYLVQTSNKGRIYFGSLFEGMVYHGR